MMSKCLHVDGLNLTVGRFLLVLHWYHLHLITLIYIYRYLYMYTHICALVLFGLCTIQNPSYLGQIILGSICYQDGFDPNIDLGTQEVSCL